MSNTNPALRLKLNKMTDAELLNITENLGDQTVVQVAADILNKRLESQTKEVTK